MQGTKIKLTYAKRIIRHKWYVFQECMKLGIPWRGITHDMSKFSRAEFGHYMRRFTVPRLTGVPVTPQALAEFEGAWHHHYCKNDHHWNYWLHAGEPRWTVTEKGPGEPGFLACDGVDTCVREDTPSIFSNNNEIEDIKNALNSTPKPLPMPTNAALEMVADWRAMSREFGNDAREWYVAARSAGRVILHPDTARLVEKILGIHILCKP